MKQFFTHLAILFLMAIPVTAYAAYPTTSYQLSPDRTILLNWNGPETDIDLTSDPAFNSVTTIRETAFKEKKNIKSIKLTSAATNIDNNAFAGMTGLQTLILPPSGISAIPAGLLFGSTAIGSISIPTSVTAIGDNAFNGCTSLSTFNIPAGVTSIGAGAFSGVAATSINLPSTLTLIGSYAFSASKLISITLPGGITAIPEGLFSNCAALTSVTFPTSGITSVGSFAFESTRALAEITLPEGITTLGDFVFRGSGITSATLPNSITTIGIGGFQDCSSLTSANIPNQLAAIPVFTFYRTKLTSIIIPNSVKSIGERAFSNIWALQEITFPNSIEYIGNFSFASTNIKTISIPQSVKTIGGAAFDTHSLTGITVDPNNTVYSSDAEGVLFNKNKTELVQYPRAKTATEYTIPSTVTTILYSAMANVTSLITITIPNSVKEIHRGAFASCINLTTVTIPGSVTGIANNAFFNCPKLTTSHIPASVTGLGGGAFAGTETVAFTVDPANPNYMAENGVIYTKDKKTIVQYPAKKTGSSFEIPIGVERIEENCFGYCYNLTNINIPNSVTHIGSSAFSYSGITSIVIPNSVTGENMNGQFIFADSKSLTSVTLSDNITGLGPEVFRNCISLTSIKLPASLNYLSRTTFVNCTALTSIECANPTPPTLKENSAFTTLNQTAIALTVPLGSKYVYKSDNSQWRNFALATERDYTGAAFWFRTTAAPGTPFTITMGSNETNRTVQVDWGDGARESSYTLETSSNITGLLTGTPQGTPAELNIRVYGSGIHLIDLNGKPVTEINTFDNTATQGDLQKLIITGTPIKVVDVSKNINLTDLNITGLALTNKTLNLVANTKLANLNAANIGLTVLTLPTSNTLKILDVSGNALTAITLPASSAPTSINVSKNQLEKLVLPTNTSAMTKLDVSYNKLNIGTLPTKPANVTVANYTYTPQTRFTLPYDKYEKTVDLSSQDGKTGVAGSAQTTTYNWYRVDNNAQLVAGTDYSVTNGTTTFLKAQPQGVYAVMTTPAFPGLKSYTGTVASPVLDGGLRTQPASITSAGIVVTLTRTFLGVISSDWNTVSNWGNNTPAADNDDVQISPTAAYDLMLDKDRILNNVTNNSTKAIVIPAGTSLTVLETMTVNAPERILIKSDAAKPNGSLLFAKPKQNTAVQASVEFYSKALSDGTGRHWQYFGTPVVDIQVGPVFGANTVRAWNETSTAANTLWVRSGGTLKPFIGYQINQPTPDTYTFKGTLVTTEQGGTFGKTTGALYAGQHVLANPFTAAVDINKIVFGNTTDIDNAVYIYNTGSLQNWKDNLGETVPGNNPGQYTAVPVGQAGYGGLPATIPSMQGFLVKVIGTSGTVSIPYSATTKNTEMLRSAGKEAVRGEHLIIDVHSQNTADRLWLFTVEGTSDGFDNGWDGHKFFTPGATQLYTVEQGGYFQVSTRSTLDGTTVGFFPGKDEQYKLTFRRPAFEGAVPLYLLDTQTGSARPIVDGGTYWFNSSATDNAERFIISTRADLPETVSVLDGVRVFVRDNRIVVINSTPQVAHIQVYDMFGRPAFTGSVAALTEQTLNTSLSGGAYLVKVNEKKGAVKVLVR